MSIYRYGRRTLLVLGLMLLATARAAAEPAPTLDDVVAGLQRYDQLFFDSESMMVCYERTTSEDLMPTIASGNLLPAEWTLAYCRGKWFNQRRFTQPTMIKDVVIPAQPKICIAKDQFVLQWDQSGRNAYLDRFSQGLDIYAGLYFTRNLSLDAPRHIAAAGGVVSETDLKKLRQEYGDDANHPFLPEFVRENRARYRVLPEPEEIDGRRCWVVEWPEMDRFWVSTELGYAVPRRKYCWGPGKPPQFEFRNSDFREVKPGLWLPMTQVVDRFASIVAEEESLWGKVACRTQYKVKSIHFDDVPESQFDVDMPDGILVYDAARRFSYLVTNRDNADPFSMPVKDGRHLLAQPGRRSTFIVMSSLLVLCVVCLVWRRRSRRNHP